MPTSHFGRASWRTFTIQVLALAGLGLFLKFYLPHRAREAAAHAAAVRDHRIVALFQDSVVEESKREVSVPLEGAIVKRHPQRLCTVFSPQDAESQLGAPDAATTDFRGGQHLTWLGATHKLEASFNAGRLYALSLEDRATGHGVLVYESIWSWHPY